MGLKFYKPNPRSTGCAAGVSFNSKDEAVYIEFIKQVSWDDRLKRGVFKGGKQGNVKFSLTEVGGLLKTLEKGTEYSGYHHVPDSTKSTRINFGLYYGNREAKTDCKGFSLSVVRTDSENSETGEEKFLIGLTFNEGRLLIEYLKYALTHCFDAMYSEDKKRRAAAMDKKAGEKPATKASETPEKTSEPQAAFSETDPFAEDQPEAAPAKDKTPAKASDPEEDIF